MGEWSKTVGEFGEKTVENFLELIGWARVPKNISLGCVKPKEHAEEGKARQTHGIDFYFSYLSPLSDNTRNNIHISSKYTADPYPNAPTRKFKDYIQDLARAIDCFKFSPEKRELFSSLKGYKHTEEIGVLFWLSNSPTYDNMISRVATANIVLEGPIKSLYVVDNYRIEFVFQAIRFAQNKYRGQHVNFFYPSTGKNINPTVKKDYGRILPVEYINASILPIRVQNETGMTGLLLFSIEAFTPNDLKRLIGLAQDLSKSWSGFIEISFPDYNPLSHGEDERRVKSDFQEENFVNNVYVSSYNESFTSIN